MKPDNLNKWLTLGANVGVLIGIILLVAELNQNSTLMRAQIFNGQLHKAERRLHCAHAVLEADAVVEEVRIARQSAVIAEDEALLVNVIAIGEQHAALAGGECLGAVEAEGADVAEAPGGSVSAG